MYPPKDWISAATTWQKAGLAYGQMVMTANQVIAMRTMQMALGTMKPAEAARMVMEKPTAFAKSMEMATRSAAASRGIAAATLAGIKPIGAKTKSNAKRLRKQKR